MGHCGTPAGRELGASAVEYALVAAGITATFLIAALGLQGAVAQVFGHAVSAVQEDPALQQPPAVQQTP